MRLYRKLAMVLCLLMTVSSLSLPVLNGNAVLADTDSSETTVIEDVDFDSQSNDSESDDFDVEVFEDKDEDVWAEDISMGYKVMPEECVKKIHIAANSFADSVDLSMYKIPCSNDTELNTYWATGLSRPDMERSSSR